MSTSSHPDRWLLPRRQTEFPLRDLLPEETLHARREATFLVLAALALLPVAALVLLGAARVIDLSALVAQVAPATDLPVALQLPLAAAPFAVSLVAVAVACELFGRRRANALVWAGAVSALALAGFVRLADVLGDGDAFGVALASAAACVVALIANVFVVDGLRRAARGRARFLRIVSGAFVASMLGFAAFAGVMRLEAGSELAPAVGVAGDAIAAGSAVWTFALAIVLAIPAAIVVRLVGVALRVGRELVIEGVGVERELVIEDAAARKPEPVVDPTPASPAFVPADRVRFAKASSALAVDRTAPAPSGERVARVMTAVAPPTTIPPPFAEGSVSRNLPPAEIVDEDVVALGPETMRRRAARPSLQPFSSAEMEFFREGDELETTS